MTPLMWGAIGIAVGAAALHTTLGIRRPIDRASLSFALMMAFLAAYFYFGLTLRQAASTEAAIEAVRRQMAAVLSCHGCLLVFVPAYTNVRIPRTVRTAYWLGLAVLLVANLVAVHGVTFLGPHSRTNIERHMSVLEYACAVYFSSILILGFACAVAAFRRGYRRRSSTFAVALSLVFTGYVVDLVRDNVAATWPYVGELGFAAWALIMSVQLGHDFRVQATTLAAALSNAEAQAARLRSILDALLALERHMRGPTESLAAGLEAIVPETPAEEVLLHRLQRAAARLRECARAMPELGLPASSIADRVPRSSDP